MKLSLCLFSAAMLTGMAWAQEPRATQTQTADQTTASTTGQNLSGILMDASCPVIQSSPTASSVSSYTAGSTAGAHTPGQTTAASPAGAARTPTGVTQAGTPTAATTGATERIEGARITDRATQMPRTTARAGEVNQPETGIAGATPPANPAAQARVTPGPATPDGAAQTPTAADEATRARAADATMVPTTVREKYKDCKVTPSTTSFAVYSNGQLTRLDDASNMMLRNKFTSDTTLSTRMNANEWFSVDLTGSMIGDRYSVKDFHSSK